MTPQEAIQSLQSQGVDTDAVIAQLDKEGYDTTPLQQHQSFMKQAWDALKVPEQKSREGLKMIADAVPDTVGGPMTGNTALDVAKGTPKVIADTMAQVAPGFVSRGSLLAMGAGAAAGPALRAAGRGVTGLQESLTGVPAETYQAVANDPSLLSAPGRESVSQGYQAAKGVPLMEDASTGAKAYINPGTSSGTEIGGQVRDSLAQIPGKREFVTKAIELADSGNLNPTEALEARKSLDSIQDQVSGPYFAKARSTLDGIAKTAFAGNDAAYQRALMAEQLRNVGPINNSGKQSIMRVAGALASQSPLGFMVSPALNGAVDAGAGAVGNAVLNNPAAGAGMTAVLQNLAKYRKKDNDQ